MNLDDMQKGILILEGSRGSNGWSIFFHAAQVSGFGPAAMVFPHLDSRTAVTAAVLNVPMLTDLEDDPFALIGVGDRVLVDADRGLLTLIDSAGDLTTLQGDAWIDALNRLGPKGTAFRQSP